MFLSSPTFFSNDEGFFSNDEAFFSNEEGFLSYDMASSRMNRYKGKRKNKYQLGVKGGN